MMAVQPLAEPWKISLSVSQVLGKQSGAVGLGMRLHSQALPGYQSPIQGLFMELLPPGNLLIILLLALPSVPVVLC